MAKVGRIDDASRWVRDGLLARNPSYHRFAANNRKLLAATDRPARRGRSQVTH